MRSERRLALFVFLPLRANGPRFTASVAFRHRVKSHAVARHPRVTEIDMKTEG